MENLADIFEEPISGEWGTEVDDTCIGVPVLRTTNFTNDGIISFENVVYRNINLEKKQHKILRHGDIVIEKSGGSPSQPVGRVVFFDLDSKEPFVCNNFTAILRLKKYYNPSYIFYLMYYLYATQRTLNFQNKTTGIANLKLKDYLEHTSVVIPSIEKQNRCVAILEHCQHMIAHCFNLREKLDTFVKSRFIEMFGDPVTNPMGWEVKKLRDICVVGSSKRIYQSEQTSTGVPFLRISDLVSKITSQEETCDLYISEEKFSEFEQQGLVPKSGDILVTARGTLGLCYIMKPEDRFYFQDGMISWVHTSEAEINPVYISFLFDSQGIKRQIDSAVAGSTVAYLSIVQLGQFDILLPPIALQNQFADFVQQVDKSKSVLQKLLEKQALLRAALMQEYFG